MSSAVASPIDDCQGMLASNFAEGMNDPLLELSFSATAGALFPAFYHSDSTRKFDASQLIQGEHQEQQAHFAAPPHKTAGDAAAAACFTSNLGSHDHVDCRRFLEPQHDGPAPTPSSFSAYSIVHKPAYSVVHAPGTISPFTGEREEEPPADIVMDEFDQMLSQLPLFDNDDDTKTSKNQPATPLKVPSIVPAPPQIVVETKMDALTAISKQNSISTKSPSTSPINGGKGTGAAGAKRSRKYQTGQWDYRYQELLEFQRQHGHMLVPHSYPANQKLAQWVKRQRYQHKLRLSGNHSTLSDERRAILNKAGFIWDSHAASWQEQFHSLEQFSITFGHCNVPTKYEGSAALNVWAKHQRKQYKLFQQGKPSTLNMERLKCLNSIGFNWNPRYRTLDGCM